MEDPKNRRSLGYGFSENCQLLLVIGASFFWAFRRLPRDFFVVEFISSKDIFFGSFEFIYISVIFNNTN